MRYDFLTKRAQSVGKQWGKVGHTLNISNMSSSVLPIDKRLATLLRMNNSFCYRASLKPPFFALQSGDLMARVMTTSSGFFLSSAESPGGPPARCADTCLIRCIK